MKLTIQPSTALFFALAIAPFAAVFAGGSGGGSAYSTEGIQLPPTFEPSTRVSLDSTSDEIFLGSACNKNNAHASGSDDGKTVAWVTRAPDVDLLQGYSGTKTQAYVRRTTGKLDTTMISASVTTTGVDGYSEMPRVSANGHWVAFVSSSEKLTVEDDLETKDWQDVFLYYVPTGTVERLSESTAIGVEPADDGGNADSLGIPSISPTGRYVAFTSEASDLQSFHDPCDVVTTLYQKKTQNKCRAKRMTHIYLRDRGTLLLDDTDDVIEWLTPGVAGGGCEMPDGPSFAPSVSAGGCFVSFESDAKNLLATALSSSSKKQIFLRDRTTDTTTLVSHDGFGGVADAACSRARISADGEWVVFESAATNLAGGDADGLVDVFAYEIATGAMSLVSAEAGPGVQGAVAEVSGNGRFVAYTRVGESSNVYELYIVDRDVNGDGVYSGTPSDTDERRLSNDDVGGDANGWSGGWPFTLTTDGQFVFYMSIAEDLAPGDSNCVTSSCIQPAYACDDGRDIYRQRVYTPPPTGTLPPLSRSGTTTGSTTVKLP